jgi:hypothetical protein
LADKKKGKQHVNDVTQKIIKAENKDLIEVDSP